MKLFFSILLIGGISVSCQKSPAPAPVLPFAAVPESIMIKPGLIDEASGIGDSRVQKGRLWVQQDSGNPPLLSLLAYNGNLEKELYIKGAQNRDWEDMAIAADASGRPYIYIADIGDNNVRYSQYTIYRFPEPGADADTVHNPQKILFQYGDGPHDAEALLVTEGTNDLFVITKRDSASRVYKIPFPSLPGAMVQAEFITALPYNSVVGAALSPDGRELIIKTYTTLHYYKWSPGRSLKEVLEQAPIALAYQAEPQGEAICFKEDNSGFFTLSERFLSAAVALYFYKRL